MSEPAVFLNAFAHALSVMTLYPEGHPSREGAIESAYEGLNDLASSVPRPVFTFLNDEVIYGRQALRDLRSWSWGRRLAAAGVQRLEFERRVTYEEFESLLQEILARLTLSVIDTSEQRQTRSLGVRFGPVGLESQTEQVAAPTPVDGMDLTLEDEAETLRWLQDEVQLRGTVPLIEAESLVCGLSIAMHRDANVVLPLVHLKEFDQYTTTHSLNVSVLSMGVAETIGCTPAEVRAFGVAGLLHDIGKIQIPKEILTKPGKLTNDERRIMNRHPVDGARVIIQTDANLDLAAVVAYEHHIMLNGGGYPTLHYSRDCTLASRLVHVCDVYDALCTRRPYREAWTSEKAEAYLEDRAGLEFDPALVAAFLKMLRQSRPVAATIGPPAQYAESST